MAKARTLVGLDVHAAKIVAAVLDVQSGELPSVPLPGLRCVTSRPLTHGKGHHRLELEMVYDFGVAHGTDLIVKYGNGSTDAEFRIGSCRPESQAAFTQVLGAATESARNVVKTASQGGASAADELAKFAKLRDDGVLTDDEFEVTKAQILGG